MSLESSPVKSAVRTAIFTCQTKVVGEAIQAISDGCFYLPPTVKRIDPFSVVVLPVTSITITNRKDGTSVLVFETKL